MKITVVNDVLSIKFGMSFEDFCMVVQSNPDAARLASDSGETEFLVAPTKDGAAINRNGASFKEVGGFPVVTVRFHPEEGEDPRDLVIRRLGGPLAMLQRVEDAMLGELESCRSAIESVKASIEVL